MTVLQNLVQPNMTKIQKVIDSAQQGLPICLLVGGTPLNFILLQSHILRKASKLQIHTPLALYDNLLIKNFIERNSYYR